MGDQSDFEPRCPECGRAVKRGDRFCLGCGAILAAVHQEVVQEVDLAGDRGTQPTRIVAPPTPIDVPATRIQPPPPRVETAPTRIVPTPPRIESPPTRIVSAPAPPVPPAPARVPPPSSAPRPPTQPTQSPPRHRSRRLWLPLAMLSLLVASIAAVVIVEAQAIFPSGFHTAEYLPSETWFYVTLTTRPGLMQNLQLSGVVNAFRSQSGYTQAVQALSAPASGAGGTGEDDLSKLIDGEASLGVWDANHSIQSVLLMHSNQPDTLLQRFLATSARPIPSAPYRSVAVWESRSTPTSSRFGAVSGAWVAIGSPRRALEQTLDLLSGASTNSLATQKSFQDVVHRLPESKFGFAYLHGAGWLAGSDARASNSSFGLNTLAQLAPLSTNVAVSAAATDNGLALQLEGIPDAGSPARPSAPNKGSALAALDRLPQQTVVAVAGDSVASTLDQADRSLNAALRASFGVFAPNLPVDTSAWSAGEFAVGLTPGTFRVSLQNARSGQPDSLMVAHVNNGAAAANDLAKFDFLLRPATVRVAGIPLKRVGASAVGAGAVFYGVENNWLYVLDGAAADKLLPAPGAPVIADNPRYAGLKGAMSPDGMSAFVDVEAARTALEGVLSAQDRADYQTKLRPLLVPIRALGGSVGLDASGDAHGTLAVTITR